MNEHKTTFSGYTKTMTLKCDEKIIDLVMWLNSLRGINTRYSCQNQNDIAFVMFTCEYLPSLSVMAIMLNVVRATKSIVVDLTLHFSNPLYPLLFKLELPKDRLEKFTEFVCENKIFGAEKNGFFLKPNNIGMETK